MLLYDWMWWGHLTNQKEGCVEGCAEGCAEGCMEGCTEGCAEGLPLATINLVGDNREFEV